MISQIGMCNGRCRLLHGMKTILAQTAIDGCLRAQNIGQAADISAKVGHWAREKSVRLKASWYASVWALMIMVTYRYRNKWRTPALYLVCSCEYSSRFTNILCSSVSPGNFRGFSACRNIVYVQHSKMTCLWSLIQLGVVPWPAYLTYKHNEWGSIW